MFTRIQQIDKVTLTAFELWSAFLKRAETSLVKYSGLTLLNPLEQRDSDGMRLPSNAKVQNPTAEKFLSFCSDELVSRGEATLPAILHPTHPSIGLLPAQSDDLDNSRSRWVIGDGLLEIQIVHFSHLGLTWLDARRVYTKLLLHEIGHYVLHFQRLLAEANNSSKPPIATPIEEAEAWLFANVIYGLAAADTAWRDRQNGNIGSVWRWA